MFSNDEMAPMYLACGDVGGLHARNQKYGGWQMSIKRHERLSAGESVKTNVATDIGLSTGTGRGSDPVSPPAFESLSNSERMRIARQILIQQGKSPNKSNIRKLARYGIGLNS